MTRRWRAAGCRPQALLAGNAGSWLAPGATGAPQIAYFPAALAALALRSSLAGAHLVGLLAALATIAGAYLLAGELFWISPQRRGLAVLAAGFTAAAVALFHFGRLAPFLPATAAGTFAAWALLAGQRKTHLPLLAASGILAAGALWFDRSGLIFAPVLLLWWLGLRLQKPFSWRIFVVWLASYLVFASPLLIAWILNPGAFHAYLQGGPDQAVIGDCVGQACGRPSPRSSGRQMPAASSVIRGTSSTASWRPCLSSGSVRCCSISTG